MLLVEEKKDCKTLIGQWKCGVELVVKDNTHPETPPAHTFEQDFDQDVRAKDQFHPPEHLIAWIYW